MLLEDLSKLQYLLVVSFTVSATAAELTCRSVCAIWIHCKMSRNGNPANEAALGSVVVAPTASSTSSLQLKMILLYFRTRIVVC